MFLQLNLELCVFLLCFVNFVKNFCKILEFSLIKFTFKRGLAGWPLETG